MLTFDKFRQPLIDDGLPEFLTKKHQFKERTMAEQKKRKTVVAGDNGQPQQDEQQPGEQPQEQAPGSGDAPQGAAPAAPEGVGGKNGEDPPQASVAPPEKPSADQLRAEQEQERLRLQEQDRKAAEEYNRNLAENMARARGMVTPIVAIDERLLAQMEKHGMDIAPVMAHVPKAYRVHILPGITISVPAGTHALPAGLVTHAYSRDNGVEVLPATAPAGKNALDEKAFREAAETVNRGQNRYLYVVGAMADFFKVSKQDIIKGLAPFIAESVDQNL